MANVLSPSPKPPIPKTRIMNIYIIIISVLLTVICVLLALLQQEYFITQRAQFKYDSPIFEDLIPSQGMVNYPVQAVNNEADDLVLYDLTYMLESQRPRMSSESLDFMHFDKASGTDPEIYNILQAALLYKSIGKKTKALKLFEHAAAIAPDNPDVLNKYGEFLEQTRQDVIGADELYFKALSHCPHHQGALSNRKRTAQVVESLDYNLFRIIDAKNEVLKKRMKVDDFETVKKQAYYLHIYHTVGIEGNTMTVEQLRYLLETGQVVNGKSIIEHNEILGLEKAMQYIKLLLKERVIGVKEILGIHRRVMGHVDPIKSGVFRDEKVFVGSHIPPPHEEIGGLMEGYVEWLNSEEAQSMHPVRYAALAHYKLVDIHPFADGNGRTSRLIMNLILLKAGYPPIMILKEQRERYYEALKLANLGDVRPFVRFIAQCTMQVLDMYIYGTRLLSIEGRTEEISKEIDTI